MIESVLACLDRIWLDLRKCFSRTTFTTGMSVFNALDMTDPDP